MNTTWNSLLAASVLCTLVSATAQAEDNARESIAGAMTFLDQHGEKLVEGKGCVNCHHGPLRSWAFREASAAGVEVDLTALKERTDSHKAKLVKSKGGTGGNQWPHSLSSFYVMSEGLDAKFAPTDEELDHFARIIVSGQQEAGWFKAAGQFSKQRRPKQDSHQAQTMWAVLALSRLESRDGAAAARDKAMAWLAKQKPGATIDYRVLRLLVEDNLGTAENTKARLAELLKSQHEDGGFSWQPDDESDAWATGLALYALSELGDAAPAEASTKATTFLLETQKDDGSWLVSGKLKVKPDMASYFGTTWAIIGLSRQLDEVK